MYRADADLFVQIIGDNFEFRSWCIRNDAMHVWATWRLTCTAASACMPKPPRPLNGTEILRQHGLKYLRSLSTRSFLTSKLFCRSVAIVGDLEALKWARANGCPFVHSRCVEAATAGEHLATAREHMKVLQWLETVISDNVSDNVRSLRTLQ